MDSMTIKSISLILLGIAALILFSFLVFQKKRKRKTKRSKYIDALYALIENRKDDALKLLSQAVKNGETDVDAYLQLGNLLRENKMPEKAFQIHRGLTVRRNLGYEEEKSIRLAIAADLADMGKLNRAVSTLNSISKGKKDPDILMTLHTLYHRSADYDNAYSVLRSLSGIDSRINTEEKASYLATVASIFLQDDNYALAAKFLDKALKEDRKCVPAMYLSGKIAMTKMENGRAVGLWQNLVKADFSFFNEVFPMLEKVLFESGDFGELEDILEELYEKHPHDLHITMALASLHIKKGKLERGISILEEERKYSHNDPVVSLKLASAYFDAGRDNDARKILEESASNIETTLKWKCGSCDEESEYPLGYCPACNGFTCFIRLS